MIQVAFPDRRPSRDFNEPIILPSTPTSLGPPASSLQKRRNSFDPKDSDEEEAPEGDWLQQGLARLQQRVGSDLTSIRPFDRQASEASGEFSSGGRGLGSRGRGSNRRDSGVPVRINFSIDEKLISAFLQFPFLQMMRQSFPPEGDQGQRLSASRQVPKDGESR